MASYSFNIEKFQDIGNIDELMRMFILQRTLSSSNDFILIRALLV